MGKSLLIVDDSATMRKIIIRSVRMSGLQFDPADEAGSGVEALEKLNRAPVDVILCDVHMPEMNGDELVQKVRQMESCKDTKIVMVSTECTQDFGDRIQAWGADAYMTKPFMPDRFTAKLSPLLEGCASGGCLSQNTVSPARTGFSQQRNKSWERENAC